MAEGFILRGEVMIQRVNTKGVAAVNSPLLGPMNVEQLELQAESEQITRTSKNKSTFGKSLGGVKDPQPTSIKLKLDEVPPEVLAEALGAEINDFSEGAATLTDKAVTLFAAATGGWSEIGNKQLQAGVTVKKDAATLTEGVDYEIKYAAGLIRALVGGALDAGGEVLVTGSAIALDGKRLTGGETQEVNWRIIMDGENIDTGAPVHLEIPLAQIAASSEINLLQNEYLAPEFEGVCTVATGKDKDYYMDIVNAA